MSTNQKNIPENLEKIDGKTWKTLAVVILAPFMAQMDTTIVNVSLTTIQDDLHSSISVTQWIISGYLLALALVLPINGWLVDQIGAKKLYIICFSVFTLASFLCGMAQTIHELIAARVLQGAAGGLLAPLTQFMMVRIAGRHMAKVIGYTSIPILLAPLFGPSLAGIILKYASWEWLFYVNLPIGILAVILAIYFLPNDDSTLHKRPFDLLGFLLISPGLVCLIYGFEEMAYRSGFTVLLLGALLLSAFIWYTKHKKNNALIDLDLFKIPTFSVGAIIQFLLNGIIHAGHFLFPLYLITGCALSPAHAGMMLSLVGLGMLCIYPLTGTLTDRFGYRAVASGGVWLNFIGTLPFLWMAYAGFSMPIAIVALFMRGLGQGATGVPSVTAAYASIPKEKLSFATTAINIVQRLGAPIMTTSLAIIISVTGGMAFIQTKAHAFLIPFATLIFFQLLIMGSALRLPVRIEDNIHSPEERKI